MADRKPFEFKVDENRTLKVCGETRNEAWRNLLDLMAINGALLDVAKIELITVGSTK